MEPKRPKRVPRDTKEAARAARNARRYRDAHPDIIQVQIKRRRDGIPKIYFIQTESGPIKVGWTSSKVASIRMHELQVGNHEELTLLGWAPADRSVEREVHQLFRMLWIRGEWFRPGPELLEFIQKLCTTM